MRNLTITRRKSFVASANKDRVYICDEQSPEITIEGVPCRKIGELKNGETKTFSIGEDEQQIFLIADKLSKDRCNSSLCIPAGQEDVAYSGEHQFVFGSNPFRFDGVEFTPEQLAQQKKKNRKSAVIMVFAIIIGITVGLSVGKFAGRTIGRAVTGALNNGITNKAETPKTFTKENFEITLTDEFTEMQDPNFFAFYSSSAATVFVLKEDKVLFDGITIADYAQLIQQNNADKNVQAEFKDGLYQFTYTEKVDGQKVLYTSYCLESAESFWIVTCATPASNEKIYRDTFTQWAKSFKAE